MVPALNIPLKLLCVSHSVVTPWTVAHQAPQSLGYSRREYWSGLPFPSPGDLPNPEIKPRITAFSSVQFSSFAQSCPTFCDPMDCSMPDLPVLHCLLKLVQTHVHQVGDNIQPSHASVIPFSSSLQSFPASGSFSSQFFASGGQNIGVSALASVLPMNIQD